MCKIYILILAALLISEINGEKNCADKCPLAFKCSSDENVVWATDGNNCFVARNECQLSNTNCQRENNCEEVLTKISKENCQKMCKDFCTEEYRPVCAYYNDKKETFSNMCELDNRICNNGETWSLFNAGECDGTTV